MDMIYDTVILFVISLFTISNGVNSNGKTVVGIFGSQFHEAQDFLYRTNLNDVIALAELPSLNSAIQYEQIQQFLDLFEAHNVEAITADINPSIQIAAEKRGIPYLATSLHVTPTVQSDNVFYILPSPSDIAAVTLDVIKRYEWSNVAVIYDETLDKSSVQLLLSDLSIHIRLWSVASFESAQTIQEITDYDDKIKAILLEIRGLEINHIVALTRERTTFYFVTYAQMLGILASPNMWILLDLGNSELTQNSTDNLKTNITSLVLMSPNPGITEPVASDAGYPVRNYTISDALYIISNISNSDLYADDTTLAQRVREGQFRGHSGNIEFSADGSRENFNFYLRKSGAANYTLLGRWQSQPDLLEEEKLEMYPLTKNVRRNVNTLAGKTVRVVSILEKPFTMYKKDYKNYHGNDQFEGFAVDVIEKVSQKLGFNYELYIVNDGQFGRLMENGEWNGIMGEVTSGNATMSVAPLSINSDREAAIDFTKPFKTRAINVLMKTPEVQSWYFQFLSPLSTGVWFAILVALCVVGLILYYLERYSKLPKHDTDKFNFLESMWFVFGSLVQGGTDVPITVPGRLLAAAWWFFSMILISSYTANLAAFLTVQQIYPPISQVTELADQNKIKYGTVVNSGVASFFNRTKIEPFAKMWTQMSEIMPGVLVNNTSAGLQKVKEGNYAFLWDNTVTSYMSSIDCDFTQIGPSFDTKGFGIGVASGSVYLDDLSMAILEMEDHGYISQIEDEWWGYTESCAIASDNNGDTTELHITHVAGIFFVLIGGVVISIIFCALEILYRHIRPKKTKDIISANTSTSPTDAKTPNNGFYQL